VNIAGVFLGNQIRTGGHVRYLELMEGLAARGNHVAVLLNSKLDYSPRSFQAIRRSVPYRRKSFPPASWIFRAASARNADAIASALGKVDAVMVFGETHLAAGACLASRLGALFVYGQRSNTVREELTYLAEDGRGLWNRFSIFLELEKSRFDENKIAKLPDLIVFQSAFDRDDFLSRVMVSEEKTAVIRGDISGPRFKAEYADANESRALKRVVFMGTLGPRKGIDYLVDAIILLARRGHRDLRFEIYGPGERRSELEKRLTQGGAADMAFFHGRVSNPFIPTMEADLLVVPSLFDSYPNSILEAIHTGTPVIGSRVGGIPDMLGNDELLFPPMNAEAIAEKIERCVTDERYYAELKALCASRAGYFRFDWPGAWEGLVRERL